MLVNAAKGSAVKTYWTIVAVMMLVLESQLAFVQAQAVGYRRLYQRLVEL